MKLFAFILMIAFLGILALYTIIPGTVKIKINTAVEVNASAAKRMLGKTKTWPAVFQDSAVPVLQTTNVKGYPFRKHIYVVHQSVMDAVEISIEKGESGHESLLQLIPLDRDSSIFEWKTDVATGINPFKRVQHYREAGELENEMNALLGKMKKYFEDEENVYGHTVLRSRVVDTLLISKKMELNHYPSTGEVYSLIDGLQKYTRQHGGEQTHPPMLHISRADSSWEMMAALPINKKIKESGGYKIKYMVPGNILVVETRGGPSAPAKALQELETYIADNGLSSPALPFESLVTDRSKESDTSRWVTKVYYPIY